MNISHLEVMVRAEKEQAIAETVAGRAQSVRSCTYLRHPGNIEERPKTHWVI